MLTPHMWQRSVLGARNIYPYAKGVWPEQLIASSQSVIRTQIDPLIRILKNCLLK